MNDKKKHILILPRWYPNKTDIQLGVFVKLQAELISPDFEVSLIYVQADAKAKHKFLIIEDKENGFHEMIVYFKPAKGPFRKIINYKRYRAAQRMAYFKIKSTVDLCHVHVPYRSAGLALELQSKNDIPFVITEHWSGHLNGEFQQKNSADKNLYRKILAKASRISTVSEFLQENFKKNTGFDSEIIPNYIDSKPYQDNSRDGVIQILSVSDLADDTKNITGLLSAFYHAIVDLGGEKNIELKIVGGGPDQSKIQEFYSRMKFEEGRVIFVGRADHDAVLTEMQNCDFYVCNSNFETFGMTVAEALLAGKPIISTKCGGPEEFLTNDNSILVDTKNDEQLTAAIATMCETYKKYDSAKISSEIAQRFGAENVLQMWIKFYNF